MRKVHPGFIAIAILMVPASLIIGHRKITDHLSPAVQGPEAIKVAQQIYQECSDTPKLQRTVQCYEYVSWVDQCRATGPCDLSTAFTHLIDLEFVPKSMRATPVETISLSSASDG
jgi:hypothetical protein